MRGWLVCPVVGSGDTPEDAIRPLVADRQSADGDRLEFVIGQEGECLVAYDVKDDRDLKPFRVTDEREINRRGRRLNRNFKQAKHLGTGRSRPPGSFVEDTFTDTDTTLLNAHTGETGATWTKHPNSGMPTCSISNANRLIASNSDAIYYASGTPAGVDYDVEGIMRFLSTSASAPSICGRMATGANTFYMARITNAGVLELFKRVTGTFTSLGTYSIPSFSAAVDYTVTLEIRDAAKKVFLDTVERVSSADNAITAAGVVGVRGNAASSNAAGGHLANIDGTDFVPPPGEHNMVATISMSLSFTADTEVVSPTIASRLPVHVREKPPLRTHVTAVSPSGRQYRWGQDGADPSNVVSGLTYGDTMPGGFEQLSCALPRKPGVEYSDLKRLTDIVVRGPGGEVYWQGRLERAPRSSGDQMSVSPSAVGHQAALDDDKSAVMVYVDIGGRGWQPTSLERQKAVGQAGKVTNKITVSSDGTGVAFEFPDQLLSANDLAEVAYEFPAGVLASQFSYQAGTIGNMGTLVGGTLYSSASSDFSSSTGYGLTLDDQLHDQALTAHRHLLLQAYAAGSVTPGAGTRSTFGTVAVYGNHGITLSPLAEGPDGILAYLVVAHAVARWAPSLSFTVGPNGTVKPSTFVIPHLTFPDRTTAGEIVRQVTRFELQDWAVWDNQTFYWNDQGLGGRLWRARVRPAKLSETGPQLDRLWESIVVQYSDEAGVTRTVGPPGSGADTESDLLKDTDPENPANELGITRRDLLQTGTTTANGAVEIGRQFLEQTKTLDRSGQAEFVGFVEDDRGVIHPYSKVRAGDYVSFTDAADPSYRRIVKTSKDDRSRTCTVDLDAPPEGLQELLERLQAVIVPLGF